MNGQENAAASPLTPDRLDKISASRPLAAFNPSKIPSHLRSSLNSATSSNPEPENLDEPVDQTSLLDQRQETPYFVRSLKGRKKTVEEDKHESSDESSACIPVTPQRQCQPYYLSSPIVRTDASLDSSSLNTWSETSESGSTKRVNYKLLRFDIVPTPDESSSTQI